MTAVPEPNPFRGLPQVQQLLETPAAGELLRRFSRTELLGAVRAVLARTRADIAAGRAPPPGPERLLAEVETDLEAGRAPTLRRVINATGIVLHTNLGRAPLPRAALEAMAEVGRRLLEPGVRPGGRRARQPHPGRRTAALRAHRRRGGPGGEQRRRRRAARAQRAWPAGGEVIVSRGELVEIGGGFRVPEVIAQGGARLIEVGTTNKTRLADYRAAITERTRVLLKVHPSNYRVSASPPEPA